MKKTVILTIFTLLVFVPNLGAQIDVSGKWAGTCKSSLSGSTFDAEADLTQSGNDAGGAITIILPFTELSGEADGTVSGNNFNGTWKETTGDCPDSTPFEYEISTDLNTMTGWLQVNCPDYGGEITYDNCVLQREIPVTTTSSSSSTSTSSSTTTAPSQRCSIEEIYGETSIEAELLRDFRDNILSRTPEGQEIIRLYYQWSPLITMAMETDGELREQMKETIDKILLVISRQTN